MQLGDGTNTDRKTPPSTDVLTSVAAIAAGGYHTCALTASGGVRCWGQNIEGQASAVHACFFFSYSILNVVTGMFDVCSLEMVQP